MGDRRKLIYVWVFVLLVFVGNGCGKIEENEEKAQEEGGSVTVAVDETIAEYGKAVIAKYCAEFPEIPVTVEVIPAIDQQLTQENDKKENEIKQMRVEILAGQGPDLFLLSSGNALFPDIQKSCANGVFRDLENELGSVIETAGLQKMVMEAGVINGGRYLIPLGYSISGIVTTEEWMNGWKPARKTPSGFFKEILEHGKYESYSENWYLCSNLGGLAHEPMLDYEGERILISDELREVLEFAVGQARMEPPVEEPEVSLMAVGDVQALSGESKMALLEMMGQTPVFLPVPDGGGGTVAQINTYAAVRANSGHAAEAAKLIELFLSKEAQGSGGWKDFELRGKQYKYSLPVQPAARDGAWGTMLETLGIVGSGEERSSIIEQMNRAADQIDTARFSAYENTLLFDSVIKNTERSLEENLEDMQKQIRFYFSE